MATVTVVEIGKTLVDTTTLVTAGASNTIQGVTNDTIIYMENTAAGTITIQIPAQVSSINVTGHGNLAISDITGTVAAGATGRAQVNGPLADYASGGALTLNVTAGTAANLRLYASRPQKV